jgi:multiple sugar transport system permease protein
MSADSSAGRAASKTPSPVPHKRVKLIHWLFLAPMLAGVAVFFVYPLLMTMYYSLTAFNMLSPARWNNFANWKYLFTQDPVVWVAARNTLWFVVIMVPVRILGAMFVASVLTKARFGSGAFRTIYYLPALIPPVASTIAFVYVLNPAAGPVNLVLAKISDGLGALGLHVTLHPGWFTSPGWSKPSLAFLGLWVLGDIMVIFLAALLNVPAEQYEAAELDGAGSWGRFRYITLPNMQPIILFSAVTGIIGALQYFTEPAVASAVAQGKATVGGGMSTTLGYPANSTLTFGQWLYNQAFGYSKMGYASALAVLMFAFSAVVIFFLLRRFSEFSPEVAS